MYIYMSHLSSLEKLDAKVRETREMASKKESARELTTAAATDDHPSTLSVNFSSPYSSPKMKKHTTTASESQQTTAAATAPVSRDPSPIRGRKEEGKKERSDSGNLYDSSTHLQVEGTDGKQLHHRRNLSDSITLSRSGSTDQDPTEGEGVGGGGGDTVDGSGLSKAAGSRSGHVRHHSLTDTISTSKQHEEEEGELVRTVREGEVASGNLQLQRAFSEEIADFVNKLRGV